MNKQIYTAGFMFSTLQNKLVLIEKQTPLWQKGKHNGVGGKVEPGEKVIDCMIREFREETGVEYESWELFAVLKSEQWEVYFFKCFTDWYHMVETKTVEEVRIFDVNNLPRNIVPNLKWLIPLALTDDAQIGLVTVDTALTEALYK